MSSTKVLVLCATGKAGRNVCKALKDAGFEVYGTTRSPGFDMVVPKSPKIGLEIS
jgi:nucleoside-diphosphate-sugar epimerase